jgi:hypothetical protein
VRVTIDDRHGDPKFLVERAARAKRAQRTEAKKGGGRAYDEIWCVFDCDEHPRLPDALQQAVDNGISVALSNPCFELWLILHYEDRSAHIERRHAQARAKTLLNCAKTLSDPALDTLYRRYDDAAGRARRLDRKHRDDNSPPHSNPSSDVWKLVDRIRDASVLEERR